MTITTPVKLKGSYHFIPITENDFDIIKANTIVFNRLKAGNNDKKNEMYLCDLPDTTIQFESLIKYADIIAIGDTDYNKKICEEILDSYIFKDKTVTWQCFNPTFKPINDVAYWKTARYGIHHPDASCSWKCLMMSLNYPKFGIIVKITKNGTGTELDCRTERATEKVC